LDTYPFLHRYDQKGVDVVVGQVRAAVTAVARLYVELAVQAVQGGPGDMNTSEHKSVSKYKATTSQHKAATSQHTAPIDVSTHSTDRRLNTSNDV